MKLLIIDPREFRKAIGIDDELFFSIFSVINTMDARHALSHHISRQPSVITFGGERAELEAKDIDVERITNKNISLEGENHDLDGQLEELESQIETLKDQTKALKEQISDLTKQLDNPKVPSSQFHQ